MRAERTDPTTSTPFAARVSVEQVEEGFALAPKFDADGLIPCITTDANAGEELMLGYLLMEGSFAKPWSPSENRESRLVIVGRSIDELELRLRQQLGACIA